MAKDGEAMEQTPRRLLEAAERLFAERGFGGTSVRDITAAAGCNIAAVNYHFGSKEQLYRALFSMRLNDLRRQRTAAVEAVVEQAEQAQDVGLVIDAFARAFVRPLRDPDGGRGVMGMFMREMTDPRLERRMLVDNLFAPVLQVMSDALRRCAKGLTQQQAVLCVHSLVGQLLHAVQAERLFGEDADGGPPEVMVDTDQFVAHIVQLTEAGVKAMAADGGKRPTQRKSGRK